MNANELNDHLSNGGMVQVSTYTNSTIYKQKHAGMFFMKGDDLCVKHGRSSNKLSIGNVLLVAIRLSKIKAVQS